MTDTPDAAEREARESDLHWLRLALDYASKTWDPAGSFHHHCARVLREYGFTLNRRASPAHGVTITDAMVEAACVEFYGREATWVASADQDQMRAALRAAAGKGTNG